MKKLSKIVALLLAGALTMLLFTACGGGGGDGMATKKTEEDKVISLVKKDHSNAVVTNDEGLRAIAEGHLNMDRKNLDAKFKIAGYLTAFEFHADDVGDDLVITITARYDYKDTLLNAVLKKISEHVDTDHNVTVNQNGDWSNIGVVVTTSRATLVFPSASRTSISKNFSPFHPGAWLQGRPPGLLLCLGTIAKKNCGIWAICLLTCGGGYC